jgi:hypothetical protein
VYCAFALKLWASSRIGNVSSRFVQIRNVSG